MDLYFYIKGGIFINLVEENSNLALDKLRVVLGENPYPTNDRLTEILLVMYKESVLALWNYKLGVNRVPGLPCYKSSRYNMKFDMAGKFNNYALFIIAARAMEAQKHGDLLLYQIRHVDVKPNSPPFVTYPRGGTIVPPSIDLIKAMLKYEYVAPVMEGFPLVD